ncbi:MAG: flagellar basal body-associated FliL family protein [Pseudomonadota bacterium]
MADEDLDLDVSGDESGEAPKKSKKLLIIIIAAVLVLIIGAVGGMFAMGLFDEEVVEEVVAEGDEKNKKVAEAEEELAEEAIYWPIEPPFVMNFEGKSKAKYMQIALVSMSRSQKSVDTLKKHMPAVRNELTFLLGGQKYVEMITPEGKEQLRNEIVESINNILKINGAGAGIKNVFFTSFVMQ